MCGVSFQQWSCRRCIGRGVFIALASVTTAAVYSKVNLQLQEVTVGSTTTTRRVHHIGKQGERIAKALTTYGTNRSSFSASNDIHAFAVEPVLSIPAALQRCALVGASSRLRHKRLGREIDDHDTVIRVNRLPTEKHFNDTGKRTDILFTDLVFLTDCLRFPNTFLTGKSSLPASCSFVDKHPCLYKVLVFRASMFDPRHRKGWKFPRKDPGCIPRCTNSEKVLCLDQDVGVHRATYKFPALQGHMPTGGFQGFFTFAPICSSLTIYGFGGTRNIDGHFANVKTHAYELEHELLHSIVNGNLPSSEWPRERELHPNGRPNPLFNQTARVSTWLRSVLTDMVARQKLRFVT